MYMQYISTIYITAVVKYVYTYSCSNFKCFLNYIFGIWVSDVNINDFYTELNSLDPSLDHTMEASSTQLLFLDVLGVISTDIYSRATDTKKLFELHMMGKCPRISYGLNFIGCTR